VFAYLGAGFWGFWFLVSGFWFLVSGFGIRISDSGFGIWDLRFMGGGIGAATFRAEG
jgi:hypothetical protein